MEVIRTGRKDRHLNTLEKYHIYKISRNNLHINDTYIDIYNAIFPTLHEFYDGEQHRHPPKITLKAHKPSTWVYNWTTLFLEDVNTGTWSSRLGKSRI
jgi:hypothetical protein